MLHARISADPLSAATEHEAFTAGLCAAGAVVMFVGIARGTSRSGAAVTRLFLDHHPTLTERSVVEIARGAQARFEVSAIRVVHRVGEVLPGEEIVFVAAASLHRRAAFEAADYMMDRLKTEAMFWKREDTAEGRQWIEPTANDYSDTTRWRS